MIKEDGQRQLRANKISLNYQLIRNTTSPDEQATGVKSFVANLSAFEVASLNTRDNLRNYIAEYSPKKRNRVHDAIKNTILTEPQRFITRNSGFVISASSISVNDATKSVTLENASILNGAQTQGEIIRWISDFYPDGIDHVSDAPFFVRAEIIVDPDEQEVVETAIARNTATPVKSISQAGARGHLDELEASMLRSQPEFRMQKSETDVDAFDTRKLLQFTRLLMPASVSGNGSDAEKVRAYKMAEQCLTDFSRWYDLRTSDESAKRKYDFTVQMASAAYDEYKFWEAHPAWNGHRVWEETKKGRACRRDSEGKIVWVSPALVFPILGAMSEFVVEENGSWRIERPAIFKPEEMIARAIQQFRGVGSDPILMGRSPGVYDALRIYPATLVEVMKDVRAAER